MVKRSGVTPPGRRSALLEGQRLASSGDLAAARDLLLPLVASRDVGAGEAHHLLAVAAVLAGEGAAATQHAGTAVDLQPGVARYRFAQGRAMKLAGDLAGAERAYRAALEMQPDYPEALVSLGIVRKLRGDVDAAIALYDRVLERWPGFASAHANRAAALALRAERLAEAGSDEAPSEEVIQAQRRAVALDPDNPLLLRNLGVLCARARRRMDAAEAFNRALAIDVTDVESCLYLAVCLRMVGDSAMAREVMLKWLSQNPPNAVVLRSLSGLYTRDGQVDAALPLIEQATRLEAEPQALMQLCTTLQQARRLQEAMEIGRRALEAGGRRPTLYPTMLLGASYLYDDPQPILQLHAEFGRQLRPPKPRPAWRPLAAGERLRVGYVSGDFMRHSVSYFLGALFELHDKSRFEVTCYHNLGWSDAVTERFKACGHHFVECDGWSDDMLRRRIQDDGIHVLVDLAGHTSHSRVFMFAMGVAPVQLGYLGYPTVTGVPAIDYRITDPVIDPGDMPELACERPLCLPRTMFCYRPDEAPPIGPAPIERNGYATFGSFNNIAKVSDHTLALWARVLGALPGSRLLLKSSAMAQQANRANIEAFMGRRGVGAERLSLLPWVSSKSSHLETYNEVDVALDPYPYNGATTTCEALWMGVPVVTLRGRTHTSRMGASILEAVGRAAWVCRGDDAYVATACSLATDIPALRAWRIDARGTLQVSPLFDGADFVQAFEALLARAWLGAGPEPVGLG